MNGTLIQNDNHFVKLDTSCTPQNYLSDYIPDNEEDNIDINIDTGRQYFGKKLNKPVIEIEIKDHQTFKEFTEQYIDLINDKSFLKNLVIKLKRAIDNGNLSDRNAIIVLYQNLLNINNDNNDNNNVFDNTYELLFFIDNPLDPEQFKTPTLNHLFDKDINAIRQDLGLLPKYIDDNPIIATDDITEQDIKKLNSIYPLTEFNKFSDLVKAIKKHNDITLLLDGFPEGSTISSPLYADNTPSAYISDKDLRHYSFYPTYDLIKLVEHILVSHNPSKYFAHNYSKAQEQAKELSMMPYGI